MKKTDDAAIPNVADPNTGFIVPTPNQTAPFWIEPGFWLVLFGNLAAVATLIFHGDFGPWVQALAALSSQVANVGYALSRHQQNVAIVAKSIAGQLQLKQFHLDNDQIRAQQEHGRAQISLEDRKLAHAERALAHEEKVFAASRPKPRSRTSTK